MFGNKNPTWIQHFMVSECIFNYRQTLKLWNIEIFNWDASGKIIYPFQYSYFGEICASGKRNI